MRSSRFDRNIPPTPDEINAEYQKIKSDFRDLTQDSIVYDKIFIPFIPYDPSKTPDDQFLLAEEVAKKLKNKEISFADAAKEYSSDSMAEKGALGSHQARRAGSGVCFRGVQCAGWGNCRAAG